MEDKIKYRIGCSGYYYSAWRNVFYPEGLGPSLWLSYYSGVFNTVELNGTFYKIPALKNLRRYAAQTPDDFTFSVKMNRYVTHLARLNNCMDEIKKFSDLVMNGLEEKLERILYQFPPSFRYSEDNLEKILINIVPTEINAIEFRHKSWWDAGIGNKLAGFNYTFCNSDYPGLEQTFIHTNKAFYCRLHGRPELFRSPYSMQSLQHIADSLPAGCDVYHIYFNNTDRGEAIRNAQELQELLAARDGQGQAKEKKFSFS